MLDTNTVSDVARGKSSAARAKLNSLKGSDVACISSITEAEIHYGLAKALDAYQRTLSTELFLGKIKVLSWGRNEAQAYGILRAHQESKGKPLDNMDLLIAAHAVATASILVTRDKVFKHVPQLRGIENWATDL